MAQALLNWILSKFRIKHYLYEAEIYWNHLIHPDARGSM